MYGQTDSVTEEDGYIMFGFLVTGDMPLPPLNERRILWHKLIGHHDYGSFFYLIGAFRSVGLGLSIEGEGRIKR